MVEEQRAEQPLPVAILDGSGLREHLDRDGVEPVQRGRALWRDAVDRSGDDRPLYWARLRIMAQLRAAGVDPAPFERASRGMPTTGTDARYGEPGGIVVTGFDPYQLGDDVRRGNPSGAVALAADGRVIGGHPITGMIFPVRFADFDAGLVEQVLGGYVGRAAWIVTVSQGRPHQFDLEVWNGRRRSAPHPDNAEEFGGGTPADPVVPPGMPDGPEFVRATLPFPAMATDTAAAYPVRVNSTVVQLTPDGVAHEEGEPRAGTLAVAGAGGGYLSNEIAYRSTRLLAERGGATLGGHIHTPTLPVPAGDELTGAEMAQARADIVAQLLDLLTAGLSR